MGFTKMIPIWMLVQLAPVGTPGNTNGIKQNAPIAYYQDRNQCLMVAATVPGWSCEERPDWKDRMKSKYSGEQD